MTVTHDELTNHLRKLGYELGRPLSDVPGTVASAQTLATCALERLIDPEAPEVWLSPAYDLPYLIDGLRAALDLKLEPPLAARLLDALEKTTMILQRIEAAGFKSG